MAADDTDDKPAHDATNDSAAQSQAAVVGARKLESSYYSVVSRVSADGRFMIGPDIEVFPGREAPSFASAHTQAFEAKDRRQRSEQVALICGLEAMPRVTQIGSYRSLRNQQNIMGLLDAGIVNWPLDNRQKFAFVFEKPEGRKLIAEPDGLPYRLHEDKIVSMLIEPIARVLAEFRNLGMTHGAINADNIYISGEQGLERVILGECLSTAPGLRQHALYETPRRATAMPSGRGPGTLEDDLYALGVCVAMVMRGENLLKGKSEEQILQEKIEEGSYATIIGRERISGGLSEFLRGVLSDDTDQRWGIDDVIVWAEGRRQSPKQPRVSFKAARPFLFRDRKYWELRPLAHAFAEHAGDAAVELDKGQFDVWVRRNFEDKGLDTRMAHIWDKEKEDASRERLVACVCMAIDPLGPVRYRGLSLFPEGYGTALAVAVARDQEVQPYGDILHQQLFNMWISQSFEDVPDATGLLAMLERCRSALTQKLPGYGLERILYMLNVDAPCMSPLLRETFTLSPGALVNALESVALRPGRPDHILDRHMIAFVSVREPKMIDPYFGYINSHNPGQQLLGVLRALANIQRRFSVGAVPGLCGWIMSLTGPMIDLLHDRDVRKDLAGRVFALQGNGNLTTLLNLLDDPQLVRDDATRFAHAQHEYAVLVAEKLHLETRLRYRGTFGREEGRGLAMLGSCLVGLMVVAGYVTLHYMKLL